MSERKEIRVPDIGDFKDVEIIEVLVATGDTVAAEDALITLETDKASMDVPAPFGGKLVELKVGKGDRVSEGDVIAVVAAEEEESRAEEEGEDAERAEKGREESAGKKDDDGADAAGNRESDAEERAAPAADEGPPPDVEADLLVLGAGPGGYTAAFRAADLGRDVTLVERWDTLGGVCLNVGCIPSKALLHAAAVIEEAAHMSEHGIVFGTPKIELDKLRGWKEGVIGRLTKGLDTIAKQRKVKVLRGTGKFIGPHRIELDGPDGKQVVSFAQCIIAAGSESVDLPGTPDDPRLMDSTGALELDELPKSLLVIGGGIIGLEMACVYDALGV